MNLRELTREARRTLILEGRRKGWRLRKAEKEEALHRLNTAMRGLYLSFEREGYGVNKPGAWRRLYSESGFWAYCRDFGWRACFLGGGCE